MNKELYNCWKMTHKLIIHNCNKLRVIEYNNELTLSASSEIICRIIMLDDECLCIYYIDVYSGSFNKKCNSVEQYLLTLEYFVRSLRGRKKKLMNTDIANEMDDVITMLYMSKFDED